MKKVLFKSMVVVIIISLLATLIVPFSVKSAVATLTSMQDTYRSVGNAEVWKMAITGYSNVYCVNGGASLFAGASLNDGGNFYTNSYSNITSNQNAMRWILDNMYLTESSDSTMQNDMKNNIKRIIREYASKKDSSGKSYLASAIGLNSISEEWISNAAKALLSDKDTLFAIQQYALWLFTKNNNQNYNTVLLNSNGGYNQILNAKIDKQYYIGYFVTLKEMAKIAQSNNYVSPNSSGNYGISIENGSKITKTISADKKIITFGPYTIKNNTSSVNKTFAAYVNGEKANNINFVNANGQTVDINSYTGEFYFKVTNNSGFSKGKTYKVNVNVNFKGYKTFANILFPTGNNGSSQPVVSVRKEAFTDKKTLDINHREEITGKYNLEILKTGANNSPISGVTFQISDESGNQNKYTTNNNGIAQVVTNKEITKPGIVVYNISEIWNGANTYVPLDDSFNLKVFSEIINEEYKVTKAIFDNNTNSKEVKLKNGTQVSLVANIIGNTVRVTVPNQKITGSYSLDILKKDEKGNALSGVTFVIQEGNYLTRTTSPTGNDGKTSAASKTITAEGIDEYTIREVKAGNDYITLKDELKVYVKKEIKNYKFEATSVSFDNSKNITSKEVALKDGSNVTVNAKLENGKITVTIPNKKIEGSYSLEILKVDEQNKPLSGVNFKVSTGSNTFKTYGPTALNGIVNIINNQKITNTGVDTYTITEISSKENQYITLKDEIKVYVTKEIKNYKYVASKVSFEAGKEVTSKEVLLNNGSKVTINAKLQNGKITITVPNKKIEGNYNLEIKKIELGSSIPLSGATFKVQIGTNIAKEYGPTNENGTTQIVSNYPITAVGTDEYTISEVSINKDYVTLDESFKIYVTKEINDYKYVASKVSFEKGKEVKTRQVKLKDGSKVTVTVVVKDGKITITVPNKKITGNYSLELEKVNSENESDKLAGVTFKVQEGTKSAKDFGPTDEDGIINVVEGKNITSVGVDEYTISEIKLNNENYEEVKNNVKREGFYTIKESFKIYITKGIKDNNYVVENVSFENNKIAKTKKVKLEDGTNVTLEASIIGNTVKITVPNKPKTKQLNFDMALRKYITKVTRNGKEINIGEDRTPVINEFSSVEYEKTKTAGYYHTKTPIKVKPGDTVLYTLRVYNEGDIEGFAKEITDYLPAGLEYVDNSKINKANNWVVTKNQDGTTTVKTNKLADTVIIPANGAEGFSDYAKLETNKAPEFSKDVQIECKVKTNIQDKKLLINVAEITNYGYLNDEGKYIEANKNKIDIDSKENNVFSKKENISNIDEYFDNIVVPQSKTETVDIKNEKYDYKGLEDDDDFESIYVEPDEINIKFVLNKVDEEGKPLIGADFTVERQKDDETKVLLNNEEVNGTFEVIEEDVRYNKTYSYKVIEVESAPEYVNVMEGKFITIRTYLAENKKLILGNFEKIEAEEELIAKHGFIINNEDGSIVKENETDLYEKIKLEVRNNQNPQQIIITIPNKKVTGNYSLEIEKVNSENESEKLSGVKFTVKEGESEAKEFGPTLENGKVTIFENKQITDVGTDEYTITELSLSQENYEKVENNIKTEGFIKIKDSFKIYITKEVKENNYKATNVSFENGKDVKTKKVELEDGTKVTLKVSIVGNTVKVTIPNKPDTKQLNFDLALRKFITAVRKQVGTENEKEIAIINRIPKFRIDEKGKYVYEHTKEPVVVANGNIVTYTLRVYNEGDINGYAKLVKDDIPEGLEFLPEEPLNKVFRWVMLDKDGKETKNVKDAKFISSDYLSKENEKTENENLILAFDKKAYEEGKIKEPNYKEVKVAFKVTKKDKFDEIVINKAQISDDSDENGKPVDDKDSTPDKWIEGEDDQDIEKIKIQYFDLSLRKWVTNAITIEDGKKTVTKTGHKAEDDPEQIVKVDLKDSKINDVTVKFEYSIRVKNEGQIAGYAKEIADYIPQGLKFVKEDNPDWKEQDGKVVTEKLKDTLLRPGETAEVTILLTWINDKKNMGLKVNTAEINKDYNEEGSPDIDSTPGNKVPREDDIDDAPVMLTVKTGQETTYFALAGVVLVMLASGTILIRKFVLK